MRSLLHPSVRKRVSSVILMREIEKGYSLRIMLSGVLCFGLTLGVFVPTDVAAETVSLQEVLENVTKTDPAILEAMRNYESVVAERSIATSEYYPTVGVEGSIGPEHTKGVPTDDKKVDLFSTRAKIYARENLYRGGETKAFVKETDARIAAAGYDVLYVANKIYLSVAEAYINVIKARATLKIAEKNVRTQEKIMHRVKEKADAGFNRMSELYNSESRFVLSQGNFISRQQDLNQALVVFHRLFGRNLRAEQFVEPTPLYHVPGSLADNIDVAFHTHPALKVARYNIKKTLHTYERSKAAYLPRVDLELLGEYRDNVGGEEGDTVQTGAYLTLSYDFFDGGLRKGQTNRDRFAMRKEYQRSYIERRNVNETVRLAWNIMEAEQQKKSYLGEHVKLSEKALNAFQEEYNVGRRTLLDLLNMENEYANAEMAFTQSHYTYLIALYRIMQATGVLLSEHDTGLREKLELPDDEFDPDEYDEDTYDDVKSNRDEDQVQDVIDQCDNSKQGVSTSTAGCEQDNVTAVGKGVSNSRSDNGTAAGRE